MNAAIHDAALRRAALAVHAMGGEDREWLLGELPSAERTRLQPLLAELAAIGIPRDTELLRDAALLPDIQAGAAVSAAIPPTTARALARWLRPQPVQVTVRLLLACPDWRTGVLRALPRHSRATLESLAASLPPAPELERLVLAAARRHLAAEAGPSRFSWLQSFHWPFARGEQR